MRPLPPHWPDYIAGIPLLFVFVGAPSCFQHAKKERDNGFTNHVVLPEAEQAAQYHWPTHGLMLMVVFFNRSDLSVEQALVTALRADEPKELAVRYWPDDQVIEILS